MGSKVLGPVSNETNDHGVVFFRRSATAETAHARSLGSNKKQPRSSSRSRIKVDFSRCPSGGTASCSVDGTGDALESAFPSLKFTV